MANPNFATLRNPRASVTLTNPILLTLMGLNAAHWNKVTNEYCVHFSLCENRLQKVMNVVADVVMDVVADVHTNNSRN